LTSVPPSSLDAALPLLPLDCAHRESTTDAPGLQPDAPEDIPEYIPDELLVLLDPVCGPAPLAPLEYCAQATPDSAVMAAVTTATRVTILKPSMPVISIASSIGRFWP
jgi:hypothetical protein